MSVVAREQEQEQCVSTVLTDAERETVITTTDADSVVRIWTAQRRHIGAMKRSGKFTLVREGSIGTSIWAEFEIASCDWSPATGAKRKVEMTDERRAAAAEHLKRMRAARNGGGQE